MRSVSASEASPRQAVRWWARGEMDGRAEWGLVYRGDTYALPGPVELYRCGRDCRYDRVFAACVRGGAGRRNHDDLSNEHQEHGGGGEFAELCGRVDRPRQHRVRVYVCGGWDGHAGAERGCAGAVGCGGESAGGGLGGIRGELAEGGVRVRAGAAS